MSDNIQVLRFLTVVRNDIFLYCDTVSRQRGTLGGENHRGIVHGALCFPFPIGLEVEDVGAASLQEACQ